MRSQCFESARPNSPAFDSPIPSRKNKAQESLTLDRRFPGGAPLQTGAHNLDQDSPAQISGALRHSSGCPLDKRTQQRMAPLFGDLSRVRIHADDAAAASANAIAAAAYTWTQDVFFASGRFRPATAEGMTLLMHELVHVAQQRGASEHAAPGSAPRNEALEANTRAVLAGHAEIMPAPHAMVQRQSVNEPLPPVSLVRPKTRPSVLPQHLGFHLLPEDKQNIRQFLLAGNLGVGPYLRPTFQGSDTTLDAITDQARNLVLPIVPREEVSNFVQGQFLTLLVRTRELPPLPSMSFTLPPDRLTTSPVPGGAGPAQNTPDILKDWQAAVGGQWTYHIRHGQPQTSSSLQVQFAHGSGAVQEVFQYQVDAATGAAQPMGGVQLQQSKATTLHGVVLQGSVFLQLMLGLTQAPGELSGDVTFQVQAGLQGTATFGKISVALQLGVSLTLQGTDKPAWDFNAAPQAGNPDTPGIITTPEGNQFFGLTARF